MKGAHSLGLLCALLGVSRSGYYQWQAARPSQRQRADAILKAEIARFHRQSRGNYGASRIVEDLREAGCRTSRRRCARLMQPLGVRGKKKPRRKPRTTDSRHGRPVAPNLVRSAAAPSAPNQVWVTDITYLETGQGWLYLAAILDAWSRRVVGWACAPTLAAPLVIAACQAAFKHRQPPAGNCYDNTKIESFWSTLKTETELDVVIPATRQEAELAVFDYIETFYNPKRRHSSLGQISPVAFELKYEKSNIIAA